MIFVTHTLIMSQIYFEKFTGIVLRLQDLFFREQINFLKLPYNYQIKKNIRVYLMSLSKISVQSRYRGRDFASDEIFEAC